MATSTPEPPKFQEARNPETSCPEGLHPPVSPVGVTGVQGRGDEEGNLWLRLWLCWGRSFVPRLPRAASPRGHGVWAGAALSHILPRLAFVQQG